MSSLIKILRNLHNKSVGAFSKFLTNINESFSRRFVYRFFWGRGGLYKTSLHLLVGTLSLVVLLTGFINRFSIQEQSSGFVVGAGSTVGTIDLLQQGKGVEALQTIPQYFNFQPIFHTVTSDDTVASLATKYGVSERSIVDSNRDKIDFYEKDLPVGDELIIPPIDGVLHRVADGDTVASLLGKYENANEFNLVELNNLRKPEFILPVGDLVIVAGAQLPAPPPPVTIQTWQPYFVPSGPTIALNPDGSKECLRGICFVNPLSDPSCVGYVYQRGLGYVGNFFHNGVDLSRSGGCRISAAAAGVVTRAGWSAGGEGFIVTIDHGAGVKTTYWHGSGEYYVSVGQSVVAGQNVMYMGCTGLCTGTHLHLSMYLDGIFSDPYWWIPY